MLKTFSNFMRVSDIRNKIIFTLLMLIVFRLGTFIPVPGVDADVLKFDQEINAFGVLNIFGGGALQNFSILAMGIMPYITASIIMQLLQMDVVPKLTEWSKQGEVGRRKIAQITRYATVILGFIQALGMSYGFNATYGGLLIPNPNFGTYLLIALVLTSGTAFLLWLGELITAKGVGNGISIIIFAGIVAGFPTMVNQIVETQFVNAGEQLFLNILITVLLIVLIVAIIVGVIFIQQAIRKIPVQYTKKMSGRGNLDNSSHIPLKVNAAGVIPIIFAVSFIITPPTIASFFGSNAVTNWIVTYFDYSHWFGMILYVALIIAFTYFYAFVQVNPEKMAENLKKQGGFVPGHRPGRQTQDYFTRVLYRLTFVGAIFLSVVAILPVFFTTIAGLPTSVQIGGTSLLIVVGVALDTMKQLESQLVKRHYKGFIK